MFRFVYKKKRIASFLSVTSVRTAIVRSNYSNLIENSFFRIKFENLNEWIM